jgi:hypothetical protein
MREDLLHRTIEDRHRWVQEFIDRRTDYYDDLVGPLKHLGGCAEFKPPGRKQFRQEFIGAGFKKWHLAPADPRKGGLGDVDYADSEAGLGKGQTQWQAHMATATQHHDVKGSVGCVRGRAHVDLLPSHSAHP